MRIKVPIPTGDNNPEVAALKEISGEGNGNGEGESSLPEGTDPGAPGPIVMQVPIHSVASELLAARAGAMIGAMQSEPRHESLDRVYVELKDALVAYSNEKV